MTDIDQVHAWPEGFIPVKAIPVINLPTDSPSLRRFSAIAGPTFDVVLRQQDYQAVNIMSKLAIILRFPFTPSFSQVATTARAPYYLLHAAPYA